jgi:hypothetical protein
VNIVRQRMLAVLVAVVGIGVVSVIARDTMPTAEAHEITGTDLNGSRWSLKENLGKRPVLVNFFSLT